MLRILPATARRAVAESFETIVARDRAAVDDFGLQEVDQRLDFPALQQRSGRQGRQVLAKRGLGDAAVAAFFRIGLVVETRHRLTGPATADHFDELFAGELGFAQVGSPAARLRRAGAVAGPAVA